MANPAYTPLLAAIAGAAGTLVVQSVLRRRRERELSRLIQAELASAVRHFRRSVENLRSFLENDKTGRLVDYEKCKYSDVGFIGIKYDQLLGLPPLIGRDVMQVGLIYRNTSIEVNYTIGIVSRPDEDGISDRTKKAAAMQRLIGRMETISDMSEELRKSLVLYYNDRHYDREIDWEKYEGFWEQGERYSGD